MPTWIKFCGTTCLEDALASIAAGADALGFIFAPSKRQITPAKAAAILANIPPQVEKIGVFVEERTEHILALVRELALTGIQVHGWDPPLELWSYLPKDRKFRVIKTIVVQDGFETLLPMQDATDLVDTWLLDSGAGSGKTFDWHTVRTKIGSLKGRLVLAGGLRPENVGDAMKTFSPWGVDVVSGIESEPGRKDPAKMRAFVAAVRKAEQK